MSCCYYIDLDFSKKREDALGSRPFFIFIYQRQPELPADPLSTAPASFSTDLHSILTISMFNWAPLWHCPLLPPRFSRHGLGLDTSMWNGGDPSCLESVSSPWERQLGGHSGKTNGLCQGLPFSPIFPPCPHSLGTLILKDKHTFRRKVWISDFSKSKVNFPRNTSVSSSTWRPW